MFNPYSRWIFPRLMDAVMSTDNLAQHRRSLLAEVSGKVLEIGFGTGLNLPYYPNTIEQLTVVDPNPGMRSIVQPRLSAVTFPVESCVLSGEALPMPDNTFDCVVSTWTLCSIANVEQALREIHRVLKPGGRFFFIEHGLSDDPKVQTWQHRLTPIQRVIADGCHLDRDIRQLVEQVFPTVTLEAFAEPSLPEIGGYFYKGIATKTTQD